MPSLTHIRSAGARLARTCNSRTALASRSATATSATQRATFHQSTTLRAYKDDQDRESLKPKVHEYSNDDSSAAQSDAAFDPSKTRPEEEGAQAAENGGAGGGAALKGSPTDKGTAEAGRGKAEDKPGEGHGKASKSHDAPKGGKVDV